MIEHDGAVIGRATFPGKPRFYALSTFDGVPYSKIAVLHGRDVLATTVLQTCIRYASRTKTCQFCSIGQSLAAGRTVAHKTPEQLAEVARAAVLLDGPVLYLRLGEKDTTRAAADSSKGRRDGTFLGSIQCGVDGAISGDPDTACRFDGTTSAVVVDAAGLVFAQNVPYAIEAWARPTSVTASHPVFSIAGHDVQKDGYLLLVDNGARVANVRETGDGLVGATGSPATLGVYEHVVGVYDGGALRLYVNGELVVTSAATSSIPGASNIPFTVGADGSGHDEPFIGDIDEVAVYDHVLSADQVRTHYQAGSGGR